MSEKVNIGDYVTWGYEEDGTAESGPNNTRVQAQKGVTWQS